MEVIVKKELIICIIIFILIIVTNIITQNYTKECVNIMNQELDILKETSLAAEKKESENLSNDVNTKIRDIESTWNECQEKLAYYIEHDELEKVETQIFTMKGFGEIGRYDEILPELEKCVFILEHIQDKTSLNVKNIF